MIAYKFLRGDRTSPFTAFAWPEPGEWVRAPVDPCRSGVHACAPRQLPPWLGEALFEVELGGEVVEAGDKLVAERGRLVRRVDAWDEQAAVAYAEACAARAAGLAAENDLAGWLVEADPSAPGAGALLGFVAAAIREQVDGPDGYRDERARQAAWLAERLALPAG